jgi:hypothetical protein
MAFPKTRWLGRRSSQHRWWIAAVAASLVDCAELAGVDDYEVLDQTSSAKTIPRERFVVELARAICAGVADCCAEAGLAHNIEDCVVSTSDNLERYTIPPESAPGVTYDARLGADCVAAYDRATRQCGQGLTEAEALCTRAWQGAVAPGGPCTFDLQCAESPRAAAVCEIGVDGENGICVPRPYGTLGDPCLMTCTKTANGTECGEGPRNTGAGGAAGYGGAGTAGVSGSGGSFPRDPPPRQGDPAPGLCFTNEWLFCSERGTCEAFSEIGARCESPSFTGLSRCVPEAYCDGTTCRSRVAIGGPCSLGIECETRAYCAPSGECVAKLPSGTACTRDVECRGVCGRGRCVPSQLVLDKCTGF